MKHVFSAFTLYANVLRRVKVSFDEAQQGVHQKMHTLETPPPPKRRNFKLLSLKVDFLKEKVCTSTLLKPSQAFFARSTPSAGEMHQKLWTKPLPGAQMEREKRQKMV